MCISKYQLLIIFTHVQLEIATVNVVHWADVSNQIVPIILEKTEGIY